MRGAWEGDQAGKTPAPPPVEFRESRKITVRDWRVSGEGDGQASGERTGLHLAACWSRSPSNAPNQHSITGDTLARAGRALSTEGKTWRGLGTLLSSRVTWGSPRLRLQFP